jgi:hypothetical protein
MPGASGAPRTSLECRAASVVFVAVGGPPVHYDLAVAVTQENGTTPQAPSVTRAKLGAVAADLRYTGGYLLNVVAQSAVDCDLDPADDELARFAGKIGARVTALVEKIEWRLS